MPLQIWQLTMHYHLRLVFKAYVYYTYFDNATSEGVVFGWRHVH